MFRSRFTDAFPSKCPHLGPQDIERGVAEPLPSSQIESLLCALLGLVVNRKKPVEKGHYGRALEEAIHAHKSSWPRAWGNINPVNGGRSFNTMTSSERLTLLKTLILWSLHSSEVISAMLKDSYKSRTSKEKNDINIPLSVQPWGEDGDKRKYWLIEGQDDTAFRVYRESDLTSRKNPDKSNSTWYSSAGSIEELRVLAQKLATEDGTRKAKALSERMLNAIPRFEATEEKRKRREYRQNRKAVFTRPEPGYFAYETRTRGKRMKYTFSDEEDEDGSDAVSARRSNRQGKDAPPVASGPTITASGRQVRSRATGMYGETLLSGQATESRASPATGEYTRSNSGAPSATGRATRNGNSKSGRLNRKHLDDDEMDDDESASGGEWSGGEDDEAADQMDVDDDEEEEDDDDLESDDELKTLVVRLRYPKGSFNPSTATASARTVEAPATEQPVAAPPSPPLPESDAHGSSQHSAVQSAAPIHKIPTTSSNGVSAQQERIVAKLAQAPSPPGEAHVQPKPWPVFAATPPYSTPEDVVSKPPAPLPAVTPTSSWQ
ncbi:hypothetical protein K504DRAFT_14856 [Pleomassaria siparia CBS 279.74]|uniref:WHIM1 domain-containing protein n=1 Tax=Pleomassaria siparia CBS 279.74 TaxID=1314801 RepID=A0A6G1KQ37_9PLEO|nr:hypothetical protein K504DRAFT_14856 [Pleomassaria siparia CBS 279.74]